MTTIRKVALPKSTPEYSRPNIDRLNEVAGMLQGTLMEDQRAVRLFELLATGAFLRQPDGSIVAAPGAGSGPPGDGLPSGGTAGQALLKASAAAGDAVWATLGIPNVSGLQAALDAGAAALTAHVAAVDPHPQYLTAADIVGLYEPAGAVAAHVALADPHAQYLLETAAATTYEPIGAAAAAVAAHVAAADPHPQYLTAAEGAAAYAPLSHVGAGGAAHAAATTSVAGFMSAADKTKLDGIAAGAQVNTVSSVFGRTGAVAAQVDDYSAFYAPLAHTHSVADVTGLQAALDGKQPLDAELTALAGLTSAADRLPYFTGAGTAALATFTAFGRSLIDDADASAARATLGLGTMATQSASSYLPLTGGTITGPVEITTNSALSITTAGDDLLSLQGIGRIFHFSTSLGANTLAITNLGASAVDLLLDDDGLDVYRPRIRVGSNVVWHAGNLNPASFQPADAELSAIAGLTSAADRLPYFTGSGTAALATFTAFGRSLVDDVDAAAARTTLGLGTMATAAAADYVTIAGAETISGAKTLSGAFVVTAGGYLVNRRDIPRVFLESPNQTNGYVLDANVSDAVFDRFRILRRDNSAELLTLTNFGALTVGSVTTAGDVITGGYLISRRNIPRVHLESPNTINGYIVDANVSDAVFGSFRILRRDTGAVIFDLNNAAQLTGLATITTTGAITVGGAVTIAGLAGSGDRMVVANASGVLSTQAIPGGGAAAVTSVFARTGAVVADVADYTAFYLRRDGANIMNADLVLDSDISGARLRFLVSPPAPPAPAAYLNLGLSGDGLAISDDALGDLLTVSPSAGTTVHSLAGTGTRMVVASSVGLLSTQALPGASAVYLRQAANINNTTPGTRTNTSLQFSATANTRYILKGYCRYTAVATTTGIQPAITAPAGATVFGKCAKRTATAVGTDSETVGVWTAANTVIAFGTSMTADGWLEFWAIVEVNGTAGTVGLQFQSEVSGSSVQILAGSVMSYAVLP